MSACVFCAIAVGEAPATVVDQDADTMAFLDIHPWAPGHSLVIPRRHYPDLLEIDPNDLARTYGAAQRLAARMAERDDAKGVLVWNSSGRAAGQVVMHFHVHVVPTRGGLPRLPKRRVDSADIAAAAAALRDD